MEIVLPCTEVIIDVDIEGIDVGRVDAIVPVAFVIVVEAEIGV